MQPARPCIDIGIIVSDIAQSLRFYRDILGLEKLEEVMLPLGRMHRLRFGESFVKLVEPTVAPTQGTPGIASTTGFRYLTFPVANIDSACAKCIAAGLPFEMELQELLPGLFVAMLRDPDDNIVELVERR